MKKLEILFCVTVLLVTEEKTAKIFGRFYRSPQVSDSEGVGIGLFLTRKIIDQESRYIKVTSEPGNGSTFFVYLPAAESPHFCICWAA